MFNNSENFQVLGGNYYVVKGDLSYNFNFSPKELVEGVIGDSDRLSDSVVRGAREEDAQQSTQEQESTGEVSLSQNCPSCGQKIPNISSGHGSDIHAKNGLVDDLLENTVATKCAHTIYADAGETTETLRVGGTVNLRISGAKVIRVDKSDGRVVTILLDP